LLNVQYNKTHLNDNPWNKNEFKLLFHEKGYLKSSVQTLQEICILTIGFTINFYLKMPHTSKVDLQYNEPL